MSFFSYVGFFPEEIKNILFLNHSWQYLYHNSRRVVNNCCYWERRRELLRLVQVVPRAVFQVVHLQQVHIIFINCCYKYSHFSDFSQSYLYVMYLKFPTTCDPDVYFLGGRGESMTDRLWEFFYFNNIIFFIYIFF